MDRSSQILLLVFVAVAACSILAQACFTVALFVAARKTQKKLMGLADDVRLHALPIIISSREVIQDISPKLKTISNNLTEISTMLRSKADKVGLLVEDVTDRAQVQAARVDGMARITLDQVNYAVHAIEHGIQKPVRQLSGILNGLRAGVEVMRRKEAHEDSEHEDLFV